MTDAEHNEMTALIIILESKAVEEIYIQADVFSKMQRRLRELINKFWGGI